MPRQPSARTPAPTPRRVAELLLEPQGYEVVSLRELQTLWAGYGQVCSVVARKGRAERRLVLKLISPPGGADGDGGGDEGHVRKMLSYRVEQYFYAHVAGRVCADGEATVARCLAAAGGGGAGGGEGGAEHGELRGTLALLLEDLGERFPLAGAKRAFLSPKQVSAALRWLGHFHAASTALLPARMHEYVRPPLLETRPAGKKLWQNGGYTYLATRRGELAGLARAGGEWADAFCTPQAGAGGATMAERVADALTPRGGDHGGRRRPGESLIHGDVKSENLFTSADQTRAAFFDFQYVGLGLGACDLAKLFTCSVPLELLVPDRRVPHSLAATEGEEALLREYRATLLQPRPGTAGGVSSLSEEQYPWELFTRHWETALVDWCRFQASWGFWGNTEWLEARVRSILADDAWCRWLDDEAEQA